MPIFQLRKLTKVKKGPYDQYLLTLPKAFGETLTSVGIDKILIALNKIGILIPVTDIKEAEKIKKRIYHRFSDIEKLIYEDPKPKSHSKSKQGGSANEKEKTNGAQHHNQA